MNYEWIKQTDQTRESAHTAFSELLESAQDFSAVFCANDVTAIEVLRILKAQKRNIKRNISVISIDNIEDSENTTPFLTTIHIPRKEMAHMAVTLLLDRMAKKHTESVRIEFPCRIVNRGSCYPRWPAGRTNVSAGKTESQCPIRKKIPEVPKNETSGIFYFTALINT